MQTRKINIIVDSIRKFLRRGAKGKALNVIRKIHSGDLPAIFGRFEKEERIKLVRTLIEKDIKLGAALMCELQRADVSELLHELKIEEVGAVIEELAPDDAVDMLSLLDDEDSETVLKNLKSRTVLEVNKLLEYPEETAGRIMIPDFFALPENTTCEEAIKSLRQVSEEKHEDMEMVFYVYVVDESQKLNGIVSMRQLIINSSKTKLCDIMSENVISVYANEDQEEVAKVVAKYDLLAVPVVDEDMKMVGIVTIDDVIDVIREEATEDFFKLAGTDDEEISSPSVFKSARHRFIWLSFCLVGGLVDIWVIGYFSNVISKLAILAGFIPVILNMGGNVGNQSTTIMVRGIATGRLKMSNWRKSFVREIQTAAILGVSYGLMLTVLSIVLFKAGEGVAVKLGFKIGAAASFGYSQALVLGLVIGGALFFAMSFASFIGAGLPIFFKKVGIDPAVATGPLVMTSVDIVGVFIYLSMATVWLLPML